MLHSFVYQSGKAISKNVSRAEMFNALGNKEAFLWVDLEDPTEFESDSLVEIFNFHPLAVEDCVNDISQPKVDGYDEYLFLVVHGIDFNSKEELATIELDIFLGKNFVVTYHRAPLKSVSHVREMVEKNAESLLSEGMDILVYSILDHLVELYQPVLDQYDQKIDQLEDEIFNNPPKNYLSTIMRLKRDVFHFRRIIAPQRDTISYLTRTPSPFIRTQSMLYFRDVYDHLFRIYGMIEGFHEAITGILQAYFSYSSHKINETMKRMTVLATLTMPSIIIASIYGMNFQFMPELNWKFGYLFSLGLMFMSSVVMLIWMKFKKWI